MAQAICHECKSHVLLESYQDYKSDDKENLLAPNGYDYKSDVKAFVAHLESVKVKYKELNPQFINFFNFKKLILFYNP